MKPSASTPLRSTQGYDLLFASNYLGHFLLTDLLLPLLRATPRARILQVCSNSHYMATERALDTAGGRLLPDAARALSTAMLQGQQGREQQEREQVRWEAAYGLSKLAQVMHAVELQRVLDGDDSTDLKVSMSLVTPLVT
jgi:NAD(P)-dependent dehydrogenase (short-subunit alcohol dehydrogenase family)